MSKYDLGRKIAETYDYVQEHKAKVIGRLAAVAIAIVSLYQLTRPVGANNVELEPKAWLPYISKSEPTPTPTLERPTPGSPPPTSTPPPFPTRTIPPFETRTPTPTH